MVRIIVHVQDGSDVAHVDGGKMIHIHRIFDVEAPELEKFMSSDMPYCSRQIIGVSLDAPRKD